MKRIVSLMLCFVLVFGLTACGSQKEADNSPAPSVSEPQSTESPVQSDTDLEASAEATELETAKTLVVYFSLPETTNPDNMTKEEDNSVVVINGEVLGNTQYMAYVIQQNTGADIFRIEPEIPYTTNHSDLVDLAKEEQNENARPAISGSIENFEDYDTVFIGYPIWWSDLPMIMYTFFDTYDFSGKTIVPFSTHGGSSFAGTPATIAELEPGATIADGMTISRDDIQEAEPDIVSWLENAGYVK